MSYAREAMGRDPIGSLLWRFSLPSIAGMLAAGIYNIVDRIFVARGVGADALAGVAVTFPIIMFVQALSMLVGHGAASVISLRLGEGRLDRAEAVIGNGLTLALLIGTTVTVATGLFYQPLLALCGASAQTLGYATTFILVLLPGLLLQMLGFVLNNMIRGQGRPVTALISMAASAGVNLILNPLFIFVIGLGIAGSALATDIAQGIVVVWLLLVYRRGHSGLRLRRSAMRLRLNVIREIFAVGIAPCFMQLAGSATLVIANQIVSSYAGDTGVAVMGIAGSLVMLFSMPIIGLRAGVQPLLGYNYGAKKFARVQKTLVLAIGISMLFGLAVYIGFFVLAEDIVRLFSKDSPDLIALGVPSLRILFCTLPLIGISILGSVYFQSIGKGFSALALNVVRQLVALIPLYYLLSWLFGINGFWAAAPVSDILAAAASLLLLFPEFRRLRRLTTRDDAARPSSELAAASVHAHE